MGTETFNEMFARLLRPGARGGAARSAEAFLMTPHFVTSVLHLPLAWRPDAHRRSGERGA
jgi:hypothetical protein